MILLTLKMATGSTETSVLTHHNTWYQIDFPILLIILNMFLLILLSPLVVPL
jgi:hypothetical protein